MQHNIYEIILTVAQSRSYAEASSKLYISPSAISQAILKYESTIGIQLFVKNSKGIFLTVNGETLLPYFKRIMTAESDLQTATKNLRGAAEGKIYIGAIGSCCHLLLHQLLQLVEQHYPNVMVHVEQASYETLLAELKAHRIEFAITASSAIDDSMAFIPLFNDEYMLVTPPGQEPTQNPIPIAELKKMELVSPCSGNDNDIKKIFTSLSLPYRTRYQSNDFLATLSMVNNGLGAGLVSQLVLDSYSIPANIYHLDPPFFRTIGIAYPKDIPLSPIAQAITHLVNEIKIKTGRSESRSSKSTNCSGNFIEKQE